MQINSIHFNTPELVPLPRYSNITVQIGEIRLSRNIPGFGALLYIVQEKLQLNGDYENGRSLQWVPLLS